MFTIFAIVHIVLCLSLMGLVLLQQGKGADAGAVMGGGGDSLMAVGSAGAAVTKITTALAIGFMVTSIVLVKLYDQSISAPASVSDSSVLSGSVMEGTVVPDAKAGNTETQPATDTNNTATEPKSDTE